MPDPINDRLENFDPGEPVSVPASKIRRRGDRPRRRNTALSVAAGVAAVALIATPITLLAGGDDPGTIASTTQSPTVTDPAPSPAPSEDTQPPASTPTIPDDFPLDDGLPETNGDDGSPVAVTDQPPIKRIEQCGDVAWTPRGPAAASVDVAGVSFTGEAEYSLARTLVLYASEDDAAAALTGIREDLGDCPVDSVGGTDQVYEEVESSQSADGVESSTFTHRYRSEGRFDTGLEVLQLVRVGDALLLTSSYGEGGGSESSIETELDNAHQLVQGVVSAMVDAFAGTDPTGDGRDEEDTTGISAENLLAVVDLPARERLGTWREADAGAAPTLACVPTDLPAEGAFTAFEAQGAGDPGGKAIGRVHSAVYQYADEELAAGAFAEVAAQLRTCPEAEGFRQGERGDATGLGGDRVEWRAFSYLAPEICADDCDAAWFDRMGVAQVGDRVVLLSYAEVGGPLEPDGLDQVMRDLLAQAISLA